jgi:hypothetical protein
MSDIEEGLLVENDGIEIECKIYYFLYAGMLLVFISFVLLILLYPF